MVVIRQKLFHGNKNIALMNGKVLTREDNHFLFSSQQQEKFSKN
jgi:hypothetical protein